MDNAANGARRPHVIIVGAGFGGLLAAQGLGGAPVDVTVIDRTNHHVFQPLLYQVATAGLSPAEIAAPIRVVLRKQRNTDVLMTEITGVDLARRCVVAGEREFPYDYLILATGSHYNYFGHPEWSRVAPSLKSIEDATAIRGRILSAFEAAEIEQDPEKRAALLTFILVGAGPTGVEMAGSIAELARVALKSDFRHFDPTSSRILLLEAGPRILAAFPEALAAASARKLEQLGVEIRTGSPVENVDEEGVIVKGERIASRTVLWTAGVLASPTTNWLGAETDRTGRIKVNPDLSVPGQPNVFVVGDSAYIEHNGKPLPGLAPVAKQEGRYVASVIRSLVAGKKEHRPFHYFDKGNLATVGRSFAIADLGKIRFSGLLGWLVWVVVHIYYLIGFRNRILVLIQWASAYFTFQRGARLITQVKHPEAIEQPVASLAGKKTEEPVN